MAETKPILLLVEDDLDVADMLNAYFRVQGYEVLTVNWGEDALKICTTTLPDMIILDIRLPDIDGFEVARRLRTNRRTKDVPIIFLTEKRGRKDRLHGLELGADDYITKPFDVQELRLRVRNALRRAAPSALTNPVTSLPEGPLVDEHLKDCAGIDDWVVLHVSIKNLDAFREAYGFVASDDVLRAISLMIQNAVRDLGTATDFIGQFGPTELVLITTNAAAPTIAERIETRLSQSIDYFYPLKDLEKTAMGGKHLAIQLTQVSSGQGAFPGVEALKEKLHPIQK